MFTAGMVLFEVPTGVVASLYLAYGVFFGLSNPIRMAFVNRYVPSAKRATVLLVDSLFREGGGMFGQTGFGYLSRAVSIPAAWMPGGVVLLAGYPLYRKAGGNQTR